MAAIEASNGRTLALNVVSNDAPAIPTLLGRTAIRIPTAGRIRAGIKVLTRRAAEVAEARRIYDAGVAAGQSFDAIEREIAVQCPGVKNPLTPKNVPYFTVSCAAVGFRAFWMATARPFSSPSDWSRCRASTTKVNRVGWLTG